MVDKSLLENKTVRAIFIVIGAVLVIYLGVGSWLNKIHVYEEKIHYTWERLSDNSIRRANMLPKFIEVIHNQAPVAQELIDPLSKFMHQVRNYHPGEAIFNIPQEANTYSIIQQELVKLLIQMEQQALKYPSLAQNQQYLLLKTQLEGLEQQIAYSTRMLNYYIERYNQNITGIPQGWLNKWFYHYRAKYPIVVTTTLDQPEKDHQ